MKQVKTIRSEALQASLFGGLLSVFVECASLQTSLLDIEERAALLAELDEEGGVTSEKSGCRRQCYLVCCDIGSISLLVTVVCILVGVILLVNVKALGLPFWVDQLARYIISAGVFGLASGGTNAVAVLMLLYKIPLVCGTG